MVMRTHEFAALRLLFPTPGECMLSFHTLTTEKKEDVVRCIQELQTVLSIVLPGGLSLADWDTLPTSACMNLGICAC